MNIRRIGFLAVRTTRFEEMTAFCDQVLGLETSHREPGWTIFSLDSGPLDMLEVYGPEKLDDRLFPLTADGALMVAFIVDDVEAARAEVVAAGVEVLGETVWAAELSGDPELEGLAWFFIRAPDGNVYAVEQQGSRDRP